ncbi:MAG: alginate export family protein [Bdellovibrionaceae bacterium]|nr:alginate export family protein [Pseudobdellovibrionaceae bacterium]
MGQQCPHFRRRPGHLQDRQPDRRLLCRLCRPPQNGRIQHPRFRGPVHRRLCPIQRLEPFFHRRLRPGPLQERCRNLHRVHPLGADGRQHQPAGDYATLGTLWQSKKNAFGPWDANAELALQAGEISNPAGFGPIVAGNPVNIHRQDLLAFASHIEAGYTFLTAHGQPRLYLEYNYSTGDGDPGDGTSHTFQNLFPTNHLFYGDMDRFSWQNLHNAAGGIHWKPADKLTLKAAYHLFWLADTDDVWRFAGQGAVGGAGRYGNALNRNPSSFVGSELNLNLRYQAAPWFAIEGGYAHFFAGGYIAGTMPVEDVGGDDADFAYVQILWQF